jgi:hypothetical protein
MNRDVKLAFRIVWAILTLLGVVLLITPGLIAAETISRAVPMCEAKARGLECVLCGMTTAFYALWRGDFAGAAHANAGAMPLFVALALNALFFGFTVSKRKPERGM